jgi:hypothetical protein
MHPEGDRMGMFVLDADGHELNVVQISVDPRHLDDDLNRYTHSHHGSEGGHSDEGRSEQ